MKRNWLDEIEVTYCIMEVRRKIVRLRSKIGERTAIKDLKKLDLKEYAARHRGDIESMEEVLFRELAVRGKI